MKAQDLKRFANAIKDDAEVYVEIPGGRGITLRSYFALHEIEARPLVLSEQEAKP